MQAAPRPESDPERAPDSVPSDCVSQANGGEWAPVLRRGTESWAAGDGTLLLQPLLSPMGLEGGEGLGRHHQPLHTVAGRYYQQYFHMAAWLGVLFAGYTVQRVASQLGLPDDGLQEIDFFELFSDVSSIALYGSVLGWLVGITCPRRFHWLFNRRRWYAWAILLGTPPVYSAISNVEALKHDLVHLSGWGPLFIAVWSLGMAAIAGVIAWHLATVARRRPWPDAAAYAASRLLPLAFFGSSAVVLRRQHVDMHLHHLYLGWSLALFAELDHWLSAVTLAVGSGIFLQGVGAYSFAPIFQESCFTSASASSLRCEFQAGSPFTLQFCRATGPMPTYTCT